MKEKQNHKNTKLKWDDRCNDRWKGEDGEEGKGKGEAAYQREEMAAEFNGKRLN